MYFGMYVQCTCCIHVHVLQIYSHRSYNNNKTDVTQEVMLHMQHILPQAHVEYTTNQLIHRQLVKTSDVALGLDVTLGLRPRGNIQPLYNITDVNLLPMHQLLHVAV